MRFILFTEATVVTYFSNGNCIIRCLPARFASFAQHRAASVGRVVTQITYYIHNKMRFKNSTKAIEKTEGISLKLILFNLVGRFVCVLVGRLS